MNGAPRMMWRRPQLRKSRRSASDGWRAPEGWEWTVPTTERSAGSM